MGKGCQSLHRPFYLESLKFEIFLTPVVKIKVDDQALVLGVSVFRIFVNANALQDVASTQQLARSAGYY